MMSLNLLGQFLCTTEVSTLWVSTKDTGHVWKCDSLFSEPCD